MPCRRGAAAFPLAILAVVGLVEIGRAAPTGAASAKPAAAKPAVSAKPASKPAPEKPKSPSAIKPAPTPKKSIQKAIAGAPSPSVAAAGPESAELLTLREAEIDLFGPGAAPAPGSAWPSELPSSPKGPLAAGGGGGLPPAPTEAPAPPPAIGGKSLAWLADLAMPDLPVRWDARVIRYLEFFRDDPRGRRVMAVWWKRSGRYRELIQEALRARSMPEDLAWLAMVESGFDPVIRSPAGAAGLWQFMPEAGKIYGLAVDRWADGRHSPLRATNAALGFLADLKKRFGSWELAMAAYNMGYGGALSAVKRFNSNDYWELSKFENGLPWETTLYVPKIIAVAIAARNPQVFGLDAVTPEPSRKGETVDVPAGTELKAVASVAGCSLQEIEALNPELRAGRTPPAILDPKDKSATIVDDAVYTIVVPTGRAAAVRDASAKLAPKGNALEKYVVKFGETLDLVAAARKTTKAKLVELNAIAKDEAVRGGTVLLVPPLPAGSAGLAGSSGGAFADATKPIVLVPGTTFAYPDRKRLFYRVLVGDTPREIAEAFSVSVDDLKTWNAIDPNARLQEGMTVQVFVPKSADLSRVVFLDQGDVKLLVVGSDEFYDHEEAQNGRKRTTILAKGGETLAEIGKKYGLSAGKIEKINRRPRNDVLKAGESVIVYVPIGKSAPPAAEPEPAAVADADLPAVPSEAKAEAGGDSNGAKPEAMVGSKVDPKVDPKADSKPH